MRVIVSMDRPTFIYDESDRRYKWCVGTGSSPGIWRDTDKNAYAAMSRANTWSRELPRRAWRSATREEVEMAILEHAARRALHD